MIVEGETVLQPATVELHAINAYLGPYPAMYSDEELRAACAKATADERERCAQLAEQEYAVVVRAEGSPNGPLRKLPFADLIRQQP
jgi:hypothetical protein